jgi:formate dehydrogenase
MGQRRAVIPSLLRTLTTAREKVKVLLVLYDGGQHAKDVS